MDPNAALAVLRELAEASDTASDEDRAAMAVEFGDYFRSLDAWLTSGGFPPREWQVQDTWR